MVKEYQTQANERRVVIGSLMLPEWIKKVFETKNDSLLKGNLRGFTPIPIEASLGYMDLLYFGDLYYPKLMLNKEGEILFQLPGTCKSLCVFLKNFKKAFGEDFFKKGIEKQISLIKEVFEWGPGIVQEKAALLEEIRKIFPEWEISEEGVMKGISAMEVWELQRMKEFLDQNKLSLVKQKVSYEALRIVLRELLCQHDLLNEFLWSRKEQAIKILDKAGFEASIFCQAAENSSFQEDRRKNHLKQLGCVFINSLNYVPEDLAEISYYFHPPFQKEAIFEYGLKVENPPLCVKGITPAIGKSGYVKLGNYGQIYLIVERFLFDCQIWGEEKVISQIKEDLSLLPSYWEWVKEVKGKEMAIKKGYLEELRELLPTWRIELDGVKNKREVEEARELLALIEQAGVELPKKTCRDIVVPYELRDLLKQNPAFYGKWEEREEEKKKERDEKVLSLLSTFLQ